MPLLLQLAAEADALRAAVIEKAAYAPNPFDKVLFPGPFPTPEPGRNPRAEEMAKEFREDPTVRWLKVVDTDIEPTEDNQQMIGFAQWNIKDAAQPPPGARKFGPGSNVEACEALFGGTAKLRVKHYTGKKHVHLRGLQVVPEHQRRGAGRMLVMWGVEEAKRHGLPAFLESSPEGHSLYLSCGFRDIDKNVVDCTKWGGPGETVTYIMTLELPEP
ncbi:acyl-CoA N-acyltransferase [Xylaria cf. heliscus]|nr:acyl-CoA N-acyltransferase [Xylaria cf. heliscus]